MVILFVSRHSLALYGTPWYTTPSWTAIESSLTTAYMNDVTLYMSPHGNNYLIGINFPLGVQVVLGILSTCAIQGAQTIGLHCVELIVNMSRDEDAWRRARVNMKHSCLNKGTRLNPNAFESALASWQYIVLFISKAILHWLLGQSLQSSSDAVTMYLFDMIYMRIFVYSILATVLATFTIYLALRRPKGSQSAAWGHFQTLADLIDDWNSSPEGYLWWGDKGVNVDGVRHAGTSRYAKNIGEIHMDSSYGLYGSVSLRSASRERRLAAILLRSSVLYLTAKASTTGLNIPSILQPP
jgi:hypothetical protein